MSDGLQRRTPLQRGAPLQRGNPLQRTGSLTRSEMTRKPTDRIQASWDTLDDIREAVFMRDGGCCIRCGRRAEVPHHRLPRGMGGASRDDTAHDPMRIISLCNRCHEWIESHREEALRYGWLVLHAPDEVLDLGSIVTRWHGQWVQLTPGCTVLANAPAPRGFLP